MRYDPFYDLSKGLELIREASDCFDTAKASTKIRTKQKQKLENVLDQLAEVADITERLLYEK